MTHASHWLRRSTIAALLFTAIGCGAPSPFVGHWMATRCKFADGVPHDLELELHRGGSYTGRNTDLASGVIFNGEGSWQQTSTVDAVAIDNAPGAPMLLFLTNGTMTGISRMGSVTFQRQDK